MATRLTSLPDRHAVLAATRRHPYVRLTSDADGGVVGVHGDGVTIWYEPRPGGRVSALGDGVRAAGILAGMLARGEIRGATWLHLPRLGRPGDVAPLRADRRDDWDFYWTRQAPPAQPAEDRVTVLGPDDDAGVADLLAHDFPEAMARPGDPRVGRWFGIRDGARLVACAADRSRGGVGSLAALVVAGGHRGRGLGAALTAAMTRTLLAEYDTVSLGVMADNARAIRLYGRLGFTGRLPRTSVRLG